MPGRIAARDARLPRSDMGGPGRAGRRRLARRAAARRLEQGRGEDPAGAPRSTPTRSSPSSAPARPAPRSRTPTGRSWPRPAGSSSAPRSASGTPRWCWAARASTACAARWATRASSSRAAASPGRSAPRPMDSRSDGAAQVPQLWSAGTLSVTFSRYAEARPALLPVAGEHRPVPDRRRTGGAGGDRRPTSPRSPPATPALPARPGEHRAPDLAAREDPDDGRRGPRPRSPVPVHAGAGRATDAPRSGPTATGGAGTYKLDGRSLAFGPLATTRAMCPPGSLSDRYLAQLGPGRLLARAGRAGSTSPPAPTAPSWSSSPRPARTAS